jgi:hypothetical protein
VALVIDAVAVGRFDLVAMVDFKGGYPDAILLIDDAIGAELFRNDLDALRRIFLVGNANVDVGCLGTF